MTVVPTSFGKYFLTEKIATGGMAEIYLAKLIGPGGFEKQLIIKQIHPELSGRPQFVQLFVEEAKTLVSLSHGNIVPVYELGVVNDTYFIAMEYIDGPTLDRLRRSLANDGRQMHTSLAAFIASELLKGLDYAHRKGDGLIHRDLSPRNVMISREGEVKLVDFGLAVTVDGQPLAAGRGGRPVGSFPYMSPEQVRGEPLDGQSDVFSTGVLLWEMLTGRSLFARASEDDTLDAVANARIERPSAVRSGVAPELDAICLRALARENPSAIAPQARSSPSSTSSSTRWSSRSLLRLCRSWSPAAALPPRASARARSTPRRAATKARRPPITRDRWVMSTTRAASGAPTPCSHSRPTSSSSRCWPGITRR